MKKFFVIFTLLIFSAFAEEDNYYVEAGQLSGIDPWMLWAIGDTESGHNAYAINRNKNGTYDIGVMQINSTHFKEYGLRPEDLYNPRTNILMGAIILRDCFNRHGNSWMAINCYNGLSLDNKVNNTYAKKVYKHLVEGKRKYASQ